MKNSIKTVTDVQRKQIEKHVEAYLKLHPNINCKNTNAIANLRNYVRSKTGIASIILIQPVQEILNTVLNLSEEYSDEDIMVDVQDSRVEHIKNIVQTFATCFERKQLTKQDTTYLTIAVSNELKCPPSDITQMVISLAEEYNCANLSTSDDQIDVSNVPSSSSEATAEEELDIDSEENTEEEKIVPEPECDCKRGCQFIGGLTVILIVMFGAVVLSLIRM